MVFMRRNLCFTDTVMHLNKLFPILLLVVYFDTEFENIHFNIKEPEMITYNMIYSKSLIFVGSPLLILSFRF